MSISLRINDIIGINSKENAYIIDYIDDSNIKLLNSFEILHFDIINGQLNTTSIQTIYLLSRSSHGYAEEKGFIKDKWIEFMVSDIVLIGQITNTDEDMIEVKIFPGDDVLYIDFAYKGMPSYLEYIKLRDPPSTLDSEELEIEYGDQYVEYIELPDHLKRYAIHSQTNDLLNDMLSTIPLQKRNERTMNKINIIISRFIKLREIYSNYNDRSEIESYKIYGNEYKPLKQSLLNNHYVDWLIPIVNIEKPLYDADDVELLKSYLSIQKEYELNTKLENHRQLFYSRLNEIFASYEPIINNDTLYYKEVNNTTFGLVKIDVYNTKGTRSNYPYLQTFTTGVSITSQYNKTTHLTDADIIPIIKYRKLPFPFIDFYKLKLETTPLYERSYYNYYLKDYWTEFKVYKHHFSNYADKPDMTYDEYLNKITHSTIQLLEKTKPSYTFNDIIYQLEPYLIYKEHINIEHYEYIHKKLKKYISTYKHNFNKLTDQFISLYNVYDHLKSKPNSLIYDIITRSEHNYVEKLNKFYDLDEHLSSSEHLNNILLFDHGKTYMSILSNMNLYSSSDIEHILKQVLDNTKEDVKDTNKSECTKLSHIYKKIVKHYTSIEDLKKDNHKPIIIEETKQPELYNLLINKMYEGDPDLDSREVDDLIESQKESLPTYVVNGHYAILDDGKETRYYKRSLDKWVETSISNENSCEVKEKCITNENQCKSDENIKFKLKHELVDSMLNEYKNIKDLEYKTQTKKLLLTLKYNLEKLPYLKIYNNKKKYKYNHDYQSIASKLEKMDVDVSPYKPILDKIISIQDISVRSKYIIKFVNNYTREAHSNENEYWYYCIKTGVQLLPSFLFKLATVYEQNKDHYYDELEYICQVQGTISEDGNSFVDKHSGSIIKLIQYNTDEGYDQHGFKIKSRDILEDEDDKEIKHAISNIEQYIINNLNALAENTGVFISQENLNDLVNNIKKYNFTTITQTFLLIIVCYFFMFVQLNHIHPVKTFPNCVLSFDGYPIPDNDNTDGLKYIACVMKTMYPEMGSNVQKNINYLKKALDQILKTDIIVNLKYKNFIKVEEKKDNTFYDIHWELFLPPLQNIELSFKPPSQPEINKMNIYEIKSVIMYFSFMIIQGIQTVMNKYDSLLVNSSLNPLVSNACCNREDMIVYQFMKKNNKDIELFNDKIFELTHFIHEIKPSFLTNTENKLVISSKPPSIFLEKTIYRAFIHVCKLNQKDILIDTELLQYCPSFKIDNLLSIDQQIELLKEKNVTYSNDSFIQLLNIINKKNIITSVQRFYQLKDIQSLFDVLLIESININQIGVLSNNYQTKIMEYMSFGSLTSKQKNQVKKFFEQRKLYNSNANTNELYLLVNYIMMIIRVIPYMIINNVEFKESAVPWKRLKLSENHGKDLMEHIQKYYYSIMNLKNEYDIVEYMTLMMPILEKNYVNLLDIQWQHHKHINRVLNLYIDHIFMLFIYNDKKNIYNRIIVSILYTFIENFMREVHYTNITEEEITKEIEIIQREEKNEMTKRLKNLSHMQRKLSNIEKELKLGEWSVGLTTSLWKYDADAYDEMRENEIIKELEMKKLLNDMNTDLLTGDLSFDGEVMRDERDYDLEDENQATSEEYYDEMEY